MMRKKYLPALLLLAVSFPQLTFADPGHSEQVVLSNPMHWLTAHSHIFSIIVVGLALLAIYSKAKKWRG